MTTSIDIVEALKTELLTKISRVNGYETDRLFEVKFGQFLSSSFNQRPAIAFWKTGEPITKETLGSLEMRAEILLWGYADSAEEIDKLGYDLRKFLYSSDWTYNKDTELEFEGIKYYGDKSETGEPTLSVLVLPFHINFSENF